MREGREGGKGVHARTHSSSRRTSGGGEEEKEEEGGREEEEEASSSPTVSPPNRTCVCMQKDVSIASPSLPPSLPPYLPPNKTDRPGVDCSSLSPSPSIAFFALFLTFSDSCCYICLKKRGREGGRKEGRYEVRCIAASLIPS